MTPEQFSQALARLGWKQSDLCRRAGLDKKTPSRWATGAVPIPDWVPSYLGLLDDLQSLHAKHLGNAVPSSLEEQAARAAQAGQHD